MKNFTYLGFAILLLLVGCKSNTIVDKNCVSVTDIVTSSACYDPAEGLTLTASNIPESTELIWVIAPLKDSLGVSFSPHNQSTRTNSIVIPDSIINGYPFVGVSYVASKNCSSRMSFTFARRTADDSNCTTWHLRDKYLQGD
ncbi:hypothetical protein [Dyadobacter sp. CY312]|uniref:hypothetical protein n=1 Tax=Dyadobacter sp. CY312 TaxID=2907303 RepID=UPI001F1A11CB|nr:hypothetical protein [Dyadobacter sp. CY312]MCE7042123.1 hypothetical protein [Dyadobacter sp. CY312]